MKIDLSSATLPAGLYVVATPIGNLKDITLRALEVLTAADIIYCEDTRHTRKLLHHYHITTTLKTYNDHSDARVRDKIIQEIEDGKALALVSDAGMPLISDPGYKLVNAALDKGLRVSSLPGANAALMSLQLSGLPSDQFLFLGFLPPKMTARQKALQQYAQMQATLILYEAKSRILKTLQDIELIMGERQIAIARELTKSYEEVLRGTATSVRQSLEDKDIIKGEFVIVIAPHVSENISLDNLKEMILNALAQGQHVKKLSEDIAAKTALRKQDIYNMAIELKDGC